jgi:hypothetical protein
MMAAKLSLSTPVSSVRGLRIKKARLALSLATLTSLGEGQKPESAGSHARGRRGLGQQAMEPRTAKGLKKRLAI